MKLLDNLGLDTVINKLTNLQRRESYYNISKTDTFLYNKEKGFYKINSRIGLVLIKVFGKVLKYYYDQELEKNNLRDIDDNVYNIIDRVLFSFNRYNKKLLRDYYIGTYHDIYDSLDKTNGAVDLDRLPINAKVFIGHYVADNLEDGFYMKLEPLDDYHYCLDSLEPLPTDFMISDHPYTFTCRGKQVDFKNTQEIPMVYFKFESLSKSIKIKVPEYYNLLNYYIVSSNNYIRRAIINESDRSIEINSSEILLFNGLICSVITDYEITLDIVGRITNTNYQSFEEDFGDVEVSYSIGGDLTSLSLYKKGSFYLSNLFKEFNHAHLLSVTLSKIYPRNLSYIKYEEDTVLGIKLNRFTKPCFVNLFNDSNIEVFQLDLYFCSDDINNNIKAVENGFYCPQEGMIKNCKKLRTLIINIIIEPDYNKKGLVIESSILNALKYIIEYTLYTISPNKPDILINSSKGNITYSIFDRYHVIDEDIIRNIENRISNNIKQVLPNINEDNITKE